MRQHLGTTVATYCLLALAGGFSFVLPDELGVQHLKAMPGGTPDVIKLTGTIHDFKKTNAAFLTSPSGVIGHYAGNLRCQFGSDDRPAFTGSGSKISTLIADTPGSRDVSSAGGIHSATHFSTWFKDTLGSNLPMQHSIDLTHSGSGIYEYLDDAFHPIDSILFGNEGESHNNYFTYTIDVPFIHHAGGGRFFEFQGCDDAWLFVDGTMAMDLGGIIPDTRQIVDMDRLGLVDGRTCTLHFFYAQRQSNFSIFRLRTNLDLQVTPLVHTITSAGD